VTDDLRAMARCIAETEMLRHGLDVSADRGVTIDTLIANYLPLARKLAAKPETLRAAEAELRKALQYLGKA
jgi:hypothetical protein